MLVVTRQRSQSIRIGDDIRVTVRRIGSDHVVLGVEYCDDGRVVRRSCTLEHDDRVEIPPDAWVGVVEICGGVVRLAVEVPQGRAIFRSEDAAGDDAVSSEPSDPGAATSMKNQNKRSATAMPKLDVAIDQTVTIGDHLRLTLTDADPAGVRVMVDGQLNGGPDDGLSVREARELKLGSAFQLGTQVTVTLAASTSAGATLTFVLPAHLPVKHA